ncbi:MAG: FeoB-associated Cys-rich membrane protein [Clostridia bacterium]|nr:FeoB-associated Cys-rich membrane protein [Clostridia bacterium]
MKGDIIAIVIICLIVGGAMAYIIRSKKRGVKCIGCPAQGKCAHYARANKKSGDCGCGCGCSGHK